VVSRWAADGVPLKVAFQGIDRYFERYYRKGPRRRPVKIDFCDADVLDVFDEWRRALGLTAQRVSEVVGAADGIPDDDPDVKRGPSLPAHLERVLLRLTQARVKGALGDTADGLIDRVSRELDHARTSARGLRGDARRALVERLSVLDAEVLQVAREALDAAARADLEREADEELAGFRQQMAAERFRRVREAAVDRLTRERFALPVITFD
jgi:hypothetical protein